MRIEDFSVIGFGRELLKSQFWFLRSLFIYAFIFASIVYTINKISYDNRWISVVFGFCVGLAIVLLIGKLNVFNNISGVNYIFLTGGYIIYLLEDKRKQCFPKTISTVCYIIIIIVMVMVVVTYCFTHVPRLILCISMCFGISSLAISIYRLLNKSICNWIVNIGMNTLPIYAIHWCLLFSPLWRMGFYQNMLRCNKVIAIGITFTVWITLCYYLVFIIRKSSILKNVFLGE